MEGHLLMKRRLIKWSAVYCCVYNGIFSYYKGMSDSMPEVQWYLRRCKISPVRDAKRPFSFKLQHESKILHLSAISDVDLNAWYTTFSRHIHSGALGLCIYSTRL